MLKRCEFRPQNFETCRGNSIRPATIFRRERLNPTLFFQSGNRAVERPRAQARAAKMLNIFNHRVAMLGALRQAREHQQRRVGIVAIFRGMCCFHYVTRTTHDVVISRTTPNCKQILYALWKLTRTYSSRRSPDLPRGHYDRVAHKIALGFQTAIIQASVESRTEPWGVEQSCRFRLL